MPAPKPRTDKPQFERFIETAREIGASETDEAVDTAVRKMARPRKGASTSQNPPVGPSERPTS